MLRNMPAHSNTYAYTNQLKADAEQIAIKHGIEMPDDLFWELAEFFQEKITGHKIRTWDELIGKTNAPAMIFSPTMSLSAITANDGG